MTFLRVVRDFPLFTTSDQAPAKDAREGLQASAVPMAAHGLEAIETEIPHCCFYCAQCGTPILLPHDSLGLPFGGPLIRRIEARSIGTACPRCEQAGTYTLFRGCQGYNTRHRFVPARPSGRTLLLDRLRCQEPTCTYRLPFFATLADDAGEEVLREKAAAWKWEQVLCSSGHDVKPPQWIYDATLPWAPIDLAAAGTRRLP